MKTTEKGRIANLGNFAHPAKAQTQDNAGKLMSRKMQMGKTAKPPKSHKM